MKNTQLKQPKEKRTLKNEDNLRDLWDNIKHTNICITRFPEEEREKGTKKEQNLFEEIMTENVPNLVKETGIRKHRVPPKNELEEAHTKTHHN